ncbi:hypothetical protein DPEC_G00117450 [Dallia pectoralis]|uniref:Uncharacterized protein n=1 Tax=Dallia pectoralis TaxID=75939 RepID=A0ACC2GVL2_DALPE|nr:hypothetical protein DPEC_G00117450 [Dallia pectoralis]
MASRLKVFRVFKELHRTRMDVFKDDDRALSAARLKINNEFRKNKNETVAENINQMIKMAAGVEAFLRQDVVQAEHVAEDKIRLRPRESLLLENVPFCDTPRKGPLSNSAPKQSCDDGRITQSRQARTHCTVAEDPLHRWNHHIPHWWSIAFGYRISNWTAQYRCDWYLRGSLDFCSSQSPLRLTPHLPPRPGLRFPQTPLPLFLARD